MKATSHRSVRLFEGGRPEWEGTEQYKSRVAKLTKEVRDKYSIALLNERNWIRRLLIKLRVFAEIAGRMDELSSSRNLHAAGPRNGIFAQGS